MNAIQNDGVRHDKRKNDVFKLLSVVKAAKRGN